MKLHLHSSESSCCLIVVCFPETGSSWVALSGLHIYHLAQDSLKFTAILLPQAPRILIMTSLILELNFERLTSLQYVTLGSSCWDTAWLSPSVLLLHLRNTFASVVPFCFRLFVLSAESRPFHSLVGALYFYG